MSEASEELWRTTRIARQTARQLAKDSRALVLEAQMIFARSEDVRTWSRFARYLSVNRRKRRQP